MSCWSPAFLNESSCEAIKIAISVHISDSFFKVRDNVFFTSFQGVLLGLMTIISLFSFIFISSQLAGGHFLSLMKVSNMVASKTVLCSKESKQL